MLVNTAAINNATSAIVATLKQVPEDERLRAFLNAGHEFGFACVVFPNLSEGCIDSFEEAMSTIGEVVIETNVW